MALRRLKPKVHLSRRDLETCEDCEDCEALQARIKDMRATIDGLKVMVAELDKALDDAKWEMCSMGDGY